MAEEEVNMKKIVKAEEAYRNTVAASRQWNISPAALKKPAEMGYF